MADEALARLDDGIWVAPRPLRLWVGDVGMRMTVIRLRDGGLLLHSPVPCDERTRAAVERVGEPRWIAGPNKVHHFHLGEWARAYPSATLCGAPGLAGKRRDLRFERVVDDALAEQWRGEIQVHLFAGAPRLNEVAFLHAASRTLVLADLAFNVREGSNRAPLFHRIVGATGRFGPHRLVRTLIRDRRAARRSLDALLAWDFDRIVVSHGEVLERGGRDALRTAFAFLGDG